MHMLLLKLNKVILGIGLYPYCALIWEWRMDIYGWTFMFDEHPSIINNVNNLIPMVEHRHCAWKIVENFKNNTKGR